MTTDTASLFAEFAPPAPRASAPLVDELQRGRQPIHEQFLTAEWFAQRLVEELDIRPGERVVDPGCGLGAFLKAVPPHADAVGIEIDAAMADYAERNSGRPVIIGDFKRVALPFRPTTVVGNPPFSKEEFDQWLDRLHELLEEERGRAAFILPAYHFQTSRSVMTWAGKWSLSSQLIPRDLFPNLSMPLTWAVFTKERVRRMHGLLFYREVAEVAEVRKDVKLLLVHGKPGRSAWRAVVDAAIEANGAPIALLSIYDYVSGRRPTANPHWQEQIRKVLYHGGYTQDDGGRWQRAA